jgi:hypothetical protein
MCLLRDLPSLPSRFQKNSFRQLFHEIRVTASRAEISGSCRHRDDDTSFEHSPFIPLYKKQLVSEGNAAPKELQKQYKGDKAKLPK